MLGVARKARQQMAMGTAFPLASDSLEQAFIFSTKTLHLAENCTPTNVQDLFQHKTDTKTDRKVCCALQVPMHLITALKFSQTHWEQGSSEKTVSI